jgi:hypothetical protein
MTCRGGGYVFAVVDVCRIAVRCNTQITKRPELRFRAVLGDHYREVHFERVTWQAHRA